MFEAMATLMADHELATKVYQEKMKPLFNKAIKDIFKEHETLQAVRWRQYTPYFNDGDACNFSIHGLEHRLKGKEYNEDDEDGEEWDWSADDKKLQKALSSLEKVLEGNLELLESMFGDGSTVIATAKGIVVDEYDHD